MKHFTSKNRAKKQVAFFALKFNHIKVKLETGFDFIVQNNIQCFKLRQI